MVRLVQELCGETHTQRERERERETETDRPQSTLWRYAKRKIPVFPADWFTEKNRSSSCYI